MRIADTNKIEETVLSSELEAQSQGKGLKLPLYKALGTDGKHYEGHYAVDLDSVFSDNQNVSLFWFEQSNKPGMAWELVAQRVKPETLQLIT